VRGRRLAIDVGTVRIGTALSDPDGILATPLATVPRTPPATRTGHADIGPSRGEAKDVSVPADIAELVRLIAEHDVVELVVGLPVTLAGAEGLAAQYVREFVQVLAPLVAPIPIVLADERMSTVAAGRRLSERGVRGGRRRAVVDQAAAVEILQNWLDAQRRTR
jgi:putative Holliday junction resolvase